MKKISILIAILLMFGCSKKIRVYESLDVIKGVAENSPTLYQLNWYDTGDTCKVKLQLANSQIIQMDNKLYTIEKQLGNLQGASQ